MKSIYKRVALATALLSFAGVTAVQAQDRVARTPKLGTWRPCESRTVAFGVLASLFLLSPKSTWRKKFRKQVDD